MVDGIVLVVYFVLYQQFENNVLQNVVYSKTVALSPLVVFIAALIGAALGGIVGVLLAIPLTSAGWVLAKRPHRAAARPRRRGAAGASRWCTSRRPSTERRRSSRRTKPRSEGPTGTASAASTGRAGQSHPTLLSLSLPIYEW